MLRRLLRRLAPCLPVCLAACQPKPAAPPPEKAPTIGAEPEAAPPAPQRWTELHQAAWTMATLPPESLALDGVTDLVLFGAVPSGATLDVGSLTDARIAAARDHARAAGVKTLLCVGGEKTGARFADPALPGAIARFVATHDLDGVELDVEPLSAASAAFAGLVRDVAARLRPTRRVNLVVLPRADEVARLEGLAPYVDRVSLMAYVDRSTLETLGELVRALERLGFARDRVGIGIDGATDGVAERAALGGGLLVWEAGALCKAKPRPCAPAQIPR